MSKKQNINPHCLCVCVGWGAAVHAGEVGCWRTSRVVGGSFVPLTKAPCCWLTGWKLGPRPLSVCSRKCRGSQGSCVFMWIYHLSGLLPEACETMTSAGVCWRKLAFQNQKAFWLVKWKKTVRPLGPSVWDLGSCVCVCVFWGAGGGLKMLAEKCCFKNM